MIQKWNKQSFGHFPQHMEYCVI